jgi:hypothetical protein
MTYACLLARSAFMSEPLLRFCCEGNRFERSFVFREYSIGCSSFSASSAKMAARSAASAFDNFFLALINEPNGMEESSIDH